MNYVYVCANGLYVYICMYVCRNYRYSCIYNVYTTGIFVSIYVHVSLHILYVTLNGKGFMTLKYVVYLYTGSQIILKIM